MTYLGIERKKINDVITMLNDNGYNIPPIIKFHYYVEKRRKYLSQKNSALGDSDMEEEEEQTRFAREYLYLINEHVKNILNNIDIEKAIKIIIREQARENLDAVSFINNPFVVYINKRVFEIDMSQSVESIMYKLMFEWFDLPEEEREIYRKIANLKPRPTFFKQKKLKLSILDEYDYVDEDV